MAILKCLIPKFTQEQADEMFKSGLRQKRHGKLWLSTGFFLPYYLFHIVVQNGGLRQEQYLAIDAMSGLLDLYAFPKPPDEDEYDETESDQFGAFALSEADAQLAVEDRVRR